MQKSMSVSQKKCIMNAFITSQFSYYPLIWMCHSRSLNNKINKIHESVLRIMFNDNTRSFEDLPRKAGSVKIHHKNIQTLAVEIYKVLQDLPSTLMSELFRVKDIDYNLRGGIILNSNNVKSVNYGIETISHLAPIIWRQVPNKIRESCSLKVFKLQIKKWIPTSCPCRIYKTYNPSVGSI